MTFNASDNAADKRHFRWLNFGSCMMRIAFDTPEFFRQDFQSLPIAVSKIWRRQLSAIIKDWDLMPELYAELPDSQFRDAWVSSRQIFESADVIIADTILDIFFDQCIRFGADGETPLVTYDQVITNFPEEPPEFLAKKIGVFGTSDQDVLNAWERFGDEVLTPTVFITYEHNDEIKNGYHPKLRERLLALQAGIEKLAERFPHWLVIDMDELFARSGGADCYVDRHHPSDKGWKIIRAEVPRLIAETGILRDDLGGSPLPGGTRFIPERGDFGVVDADYVRQLRDLNAKACAVGPGRLTLMTREVYGPELKTYPSFGAMNAIEPVELIIALKWDQPAGSVPSWISGLIKQHRGAIIELPCLWLGRKYAFLPSEECALRNLIKKFAQANSTASILVQKLEAAAALYVARCALKTHYFDRLGSKLRPRQIQPDVSTIELPEEITIPLNAIELVPIFGPV